MNKYIQEELAKGFIQHIRWVFLREEEGGQSPSVHRLSWPE